LHIRTINYLFIYNINIITVILLILKLYISHKNYTNIIKYLYSINKCTNTLFIKYITSINIFNNETIDDIDDLEENTIDRYNAMDRYNTQDNRYNSMHDNRYNSMHDNRYNPHDNSNEMKLIEMKKNNIIWFKEILLLYIIYVIHICKNTNILSNNKNIEYEQFNEYVNNEIRKIYYNLNTENEQIKLSYLELLLYKNIELNKKNNILSYVDFNILNKHINHLQSDVNTLYNISNEKNNYYVCINYMCKFIILINLINLVFYYISDDSLYGGIYLFLLSYIILYIEHVSSLLLRPLDNNIINLDKYLTDINDEIYLINYFYLSNIEYRVLY